MLFLLFEIEPGTGATSIANLADCGDAEAVQALVDREVFTLAEDRFEPRRALTVAEITDAVEKSQALS